MTLIIAAAQAAAVPGDIRRNVTRHLQFGEIAAGHGVHLLVFPELSLTGYELRLAKERSIRAGSSELDPLRELSARARMTIVAGAPVPNHDGELNIAALALRPDGSVVTYTKEHVHQSESAVFTSGPGGPMFPVEDAMVALAICADAKHPAHAGKAAAHGANVYAAGVMITEEGYAPKAALMSGYALGHAMAALMANYAGTTGGEVSAGRSAIWSEDGRVVAVSPGNEEVLVVGRKQDGAWSGTVVSVS